MSMKQSKKHSFRHSANNPYYPIYAIIDVSSTVYLPRSIYQHNSDTICPRSSDPIHIVTYYIRWVITSWTQSNNNRNLLYSLQVIAASTFVKEKFVIFI